MSTNHTPNYNLCQWEAEDKVLRTEFNTDNAKIDAAIKAVDRRVDGKASTASLNSLKSTVDSLSQTVTQHTTALEGKGNCQLHSTTYVGTGTKGESYKNALSFPKKPMVVFIIGPSGERVTLIQGQGIHFASRNGVSGGSMTASWSGNTVRWYSQSSVQSQFNEDKVSYRVLALLQAG